MSRSYIKNLETGKIELHFTKEEYQALSEDLKKELKSSFLFSGKSQAWVSRSKNNHYSALRVAEKLGFTKEEKQGERLSYEEELNRKTERAEARVERYEQYSENAIKKAESLQSEFNSHRGDISFITQPIIRGHKGSESFANYRNKIMNRYNKGFEEYRKSDYFKEKAQTAQQTAEKTQLQSKVYLNNRIKECQSLIKKLESNIVTYEDILYKKENNIEITSSFYNKASIEQVETWLNDTIDKLEYQIDKQAFMQNCIDELGGTFTSADLKEGYLILARHGWMKVKKINNKTVYAEFIENNGLLGMTSKVEYAEIKQIKIPEDYKEPKQELENPYKIDDILVHYNIGGNRIIVAYQVVKVTAKGVQIRKIHIENNIPLKDSFTLDKPMQKKIVKSNYSDFVGVYDRDWQLHLYKSIDTVTA